MKKLILSLMLLVPMLSIAQITVKSTEEETHLTFKGVSIDGTIQDVISKLSKEGFTEVSKGSEVAVMKGEFANRNCNLYIGATSKSKKVYTIMVAFDESNSWYSLKALYRELKESLKNKYNVKPNASEWFAEPYYEGDGYELQALRKDKCFYYSKFKVNKGEITVYITYKEVRIQYTDKINDGIYESEKKTKVYDDL